MITCYITTGCNDCKLSIVGKFVVRKFATALECKSGSFSKSGDKPPRTPYNFQIHGGNRGKRKKGDNLCNTNRRS